MTVSRPEKILAIIGLNTWGTNPFCFRITDYKVNAVPLEIDGSKSFCLS